MTKARGNKWAIVDHMVNLQTFTLQVKVPPNVAVILAALTLIYLAPAWPPLRASCNYCFQALATAKRGQTESTASLRPGPVSFTSDLLHFYSLQHDVQMNNYRAR